MVMCVSTVHVLEVEVCTVCMRADQPNCHYESVNELQRCCRRSGVVKQVP